MYKISKEELRKYLLEKFSDEDLLKKLDELIEQALQELKLSEITAQNIDEISNLIFENAKKENALVSTKNSSGGGFLSFLVALGIGCSGGYYFFSSDRYSVEQEYALISTCTGERAGMRKNDCVEKLKKCYKEGLDIKNCKMW
ncbi:hypothetical protein [Campylobacter armoricus]|uniref:hypothetical protein n=1 Tax=Campylobacter armoricus TaxID=2505970 RepID=UPI00111639CE|nr:hypothetical protein [Campylobacter armoricus]